MQPLRIPHPIMGFPCETKCLHEKWSRWYCETAGEIWNLTFWNLSFCACERAPQPRVSEFQSVLLWVKRPVLLRSTVVNHFMSASAWITKIMCCNIMQQWICNCCKSSAVECNRMYRMQCCEIYCSLQRCTIVHNCAHCVMLCCVQWIILFWRKFGTI